MRVMFTLLAAIFLFSQGMIVAPAVAAEPAATAKSATTATPAATAPDKVKPIKTPKTIKKAGNQDKGE